MFRVDDIYDESKKIIGTCDDTKLFRWAGDAVSLISNKADLEGWKGFIDVCSAGCSCSKIGSICNNPAGCGRRCITLPREVETVIGVNIGGQPVLGFGQLFEFHLNGPGSCRTVCEWKWMDQGDYHATFRDIVHHTKLVTFLQSPQDAGTDFIVYGFDKDGNVLRRTENGVVLNGYRVPTIYGVAVPDMAAPEVARITSIYKSRTVGNVRLGAVDETGAPGDILGIYEPDEQNPQYRRIQLNRSCNWARVAYRKTNPIFFSRFDHIALKSRVAFLLAMQARKHYADNQVEDAHAFEADAARLEVEAQQMAEAPTYMPVQVIDMSNPRDKYDYDIR